MTSPVRTFSSEAEHRAWLADQAALPHGFRVGTTKFEFTPAEAPKPSQMTMTLITLDRPARSFAAMFTRNAFPGAPVIIGRSRINEPDLGAVLINNKISNVCAPNGVESSERLCTEVGRLLRIPARSVLPCSTGVIGWSLPVAPMLAALPNAVAALASDSVMPAAEGIVTTDLYPKVRRVKVGAGSIVGIAKGAGMIEPNLATMLVYLLTDLSVGRDRLRRHLQETVEETFNCISVDSDTSTSDTVLALASGYVPPPSDAIFANALKQICRELAGDVVRNGEGVRHVIRVTVTGAPDRGIARAIGKSIVNAPLFKCAVAGNDPNVGRLVQAIGKYLAFGGLGVDVGRIQLKMGGVDIFDRGVFKLDRQKELQLTEHLKSAELYKSGPPKDGVFVPAVTYPPHDRCVEIQVTLGGNAESVTVLGGDLTHEYVSENADYRS